MKAALLIALMMGVNSIELKHHHDKSYLAFADGETEDEQDEFLEKHYKAPRDENLDKINYKLELMLAQAKAEKAKKARINAEWEAASDDALGEPAI